MSSEGSGTIRSIESIFSQRELQTEKGASRAPNSRAGRSRFCVQHSSLGLPRGSAKLFQYGAYATDRSAQPGTFLGPLTGLAALRDAAGDKCPQDCLGGLTFLLGRK